MKTRNNLLFISLTILLTSCSQEQSQQPQTPAGQESQPSATITAPSSVIKTADTSEPNCTFRIGFDVWEPYQFVDVNHTVRGLDIELVTQVTNDMECEVELVQGTWVSLLQDLQEGNVDVLLGASKTASREDFAYFSEPYRTEEFALYIRKDDYNSAKYDGIKEFIENDNKIGVVSDYYYGEEISDMLDDPETSEHFVFAIMGELNIARLLDMDIDAFLEDSYVGASMLRRKGLGNLIERHGYTVKTGDIYVMFSQESVDAERVAEFNQALRAFKSSDDYDDIMQKYGNEQVALADNN